jgi:hypothetical protein
MSSGTVFMSKKLLCRKVRIRFIPPPPASYRTKRVLSKWPAQRSGGGDNTACLSQWGDRRRGLAIKQRTQSLSSLAGRSVLDGSDTRHTSAPTSKAILDLDSFIWASL